MNQFLRSLALIFNLFIVLTPGFTQPLTQTVKGKVFDLELNYPLSGAIVSVDSVQTSMLYGITDVDGNFQISKVPVGRHNIIVQYLGYEIYEIRELIVSSGKEVVINVGMKEAVTQLNEVVIKSNTSKDVPLNSMAFISARQLTMEESNRYAGGYDDPARLASSFAGVASKMGNNGVVIRGNAPKGMLWKIEGVQVDNPTHFANIVTFGGGGITALSSQMLANSDFYTSAFPAEYGNALSGVFDLQLRNGNNSQREVTIGVGTIGLDFSSEGPVIKGKGATYLFNYRYSTLALLNPILPPEAGLISYQDLCFKLNFPMKKAGNISLWGIGSIDKQSRDALNDSLKWDEEFMSEAYKSDGGMGAIGISYTVLINRKTNLHAIVSASGSNMYWNQKKYDENMVFDTLNDHMNQNWKYTVTTFVNHKFGSRHTNRTGFIIDQLNYNIDLKCADDYGQPLQTYAVGYGNNYLVQLYSQSKISLSKNLTTNLGLHSQYFMLNNKYIIEPRVGLNYNLGKKSCISFGYGLHSQLENIAYYMIEIIDTSGNVTKPNKNLDFSKAHHLVLSFNYKFNSNLRFCIEPYYQYLYDIPVIPNNSYSLINIDKEWIINDSLVNCGTGYNLGIDITLEKYLNHGLYYLFTVSVFDSKYKGGDGILRPTHFDKGYVINILGGKEWNVGKSKQNLIGVNVKLSLLGGDRTDPIDYDATHSEGKIVYNLNNAYADHEPSSQMLSITLNYRKNKPKYSSIWSVQLLNVLMQGEFQGYEYNSVTGEITIKEDVLVIPGISYKIEF